MRGGVRAFDLDQPIYSDKPVGRCTKVCNHAVQNRSVSVTSRSVRELIGDADLARTLCPIASPHL